MSEEEKRRAKTNMDVDETDWFWIQENVIPAFPEMETHMEIFTLPSGKELHLWCDGTWNLIEKDKAWFQECENIEGVGHE